MSRYVDINRLEPQQFENSEVELGVLAYDYEVVQSEPYIDLVRCAECKKVREDGGHANCGGYLYCRKWKTLVDEDCFCSWGERRE